MGIVLIVDDDATSRKILGTILLAEGHELAYASYGLEALKQAATIVPDLILLDAMLPGMDGFEICRRLRAAPMLAEVPIIMVTSLTDRDSRLKGIEAGSDDFLSKPVDAVELKARVRAITRLNRYRRLLEERMKFERLVKLSPNGIVIVNAEGQILLSNEAMQQLVHAGEHNPMTGRSVQDFFAADQCVQCTSAIEQVIANPSEAYNFETICIRLDESHFPAEADVGYIEWDGAPAAQFVVRDITERKQAEEQIRHNAARAEALARVAAHLNAQLNLETVLNTICEEAAQVLHMPAAMVTFYNERREELSIAAAFGLPKRYVQHTITTSADSYDTFICRIGAVIVVDDLSATPDVPITALLADVPVRSAIIVSMHHMGEVIGMLVAMTLDETRPVTDDEQILLRGMADQAVLAITNARLLEATARRLSQVEALRDIDTAITSGGNFHATLDVVLKSAMTVLHVDAAAILLLNQHTQMLGYAAGRGFRSQAIKQANIRVGEDAPGHAALERRTVSITNLQTESGRFLRAPLLGRDQFVSYYGVPMIARGIVWGVMEVFHRAPLDPDEEWEGFLQTLARQAAIAVDHADLFMNLQRSNIELVHSYDATLEALTWALDMRDNETEGHTKRVAEMTVWLARAMGLTDAETAPIRRGALLHDIGKLRVPDAILQKPGTQLNDDERQILRNHPVYAYEMLSPIGALRPVVDIPYCHHEKWDGSGYPRGLSGQSIPLAARIFAVVDVWDALSNDRPHRAAWPPERVCEYIQAEAGTYFDPQVVDVFLSLIRS